MKLFFFISVKGLYCTGMANQRSYYGPCKTNPQMSLEISFQNLVKNPPVSEKYFKSSESFLLKRLQNNGGSKFITMALANVNPQNELADTISEPSAKLQSFKVITSFSHFCSNGCKETGGLSSYLWCLRR